MRSGAEERHLFVILPGFAEAPFGAADLLMRDDAPLPTIPPTLPPRVTHAWAMSTWNTGDGMRWSAEYGLAALRQEGGPPHGRRLSDPESGG